MVKKLFRIEEYLAMICFVATCALVLVGAISRQMDNPLTWAIDFSQVAFVWACVLGADIALKEKSHIVIDIVSKHFPAPLQRLLNMVWQVAIAVFLCMLIWYGYKLVMSNLPRRIGDTSISYAWVTGAIPAGALLMLNTTLTQLWQRVSGQDDSPLPGQEGTAI